jgi:hypothetical protein
VDVELLEDPLDVRSHGCRADDEPACDRGLVVAVGEEAQDLELALRQVGNARALCRVGLGRRPLDEPAHARDELVRVDRLQDVVVAADEQARDALRG